MTALPYDTDPAILALERDSAWAMVEQLRHKVRLLEYQLAARKHELAGLRAAKVAVDQISLHAALAESGGHQAALEGIRAALVQARAVMGAA